MHMLERELQADVAGALEWMSSNLTGDQQPDGGDIGIRQGTDYAQVGERLGETLSRRLALLKDEVEGFRKAEGCAVHRQVLKRAKATMREAEEVRSVPAAAQCRAA